MAVVGFCFGGLAALQLARSGAPIAAAVSIHGSLATSVHAEPGQVRARLLVCHGAMDPHVPIPDITAFAEEMNAADADWQLNICGGARHGFTHADAKPGAIPGVAYHEQADALSFAAAREFLARAFGQPHSRSPGRVSPVLAGEPGQGEVGDFAPAVVEDERVAAVREGVIIGHCA